VKIAGSPISRRTRLGGLLSDYRQLLAAAWPHFRTEQAPGDWLGRKVHSSRRRLYRVRVAPRVGRIS